MTHTTHTIIVILSLILTIKSSTVSHLEITDLNNNPAIFAIKVGKVFIKQGYHKLIHEFKLHPFHLILRQYETIIAELDQNPQLEEILKILKQKHRQASLILQKLTSKNRQKRSIELLGTIIKTITGNLDNEDLVMLNNQISSLKNSNNLLITENNEQIKINNIFEKRINNLTREAYRQSIEISSFIKQAKMSLDRALDWQHMLHLHNIVFNLDTIRYQLDTIFEAIQLSRLGVISTALLYPTELELATQLLKSQEIEITSYDQTYEYLEMMALHNDSSIVFVVKIPRLRNESYQLLRIEPIPIDQKSIKINSKFAITGEDESFLSDEKCNQIENTFLCNIEKLTNVTCDECYHQLLRGKPSKCTFISDTSTSAIKIMENNGILVKNAFIPIQLNNTCGYGPKNLTGMFFITFNNCSISIRNTRFDSKVFRFDKKPDILPLHFVTVNKTNIIVEPMEMLHDLQTNNRHRINHLEIINKKTSLVNYGIIVSIVLFATIFFAHVMKEICSIRKFLRIQQPSSTQ
ncbi:uncharacterized protein LOC129767135 [Toxorhynchites rutilus septentrionalis]|uniref:uncharacterized protein LOC129767135 n=1 Tax=Toxorhynchites rutilus septentrionalis TaxID=329112 RepID=UPI00247ACCB0|nr:uncharacterized protein LOC129767135 [Toxorhynchites rutilus septentrionalis]